MPAANDTDTGTSYTVVRPRPTGPEPPIGDAVIAITLSVALVAQLANLKGSSMALRLIAILATLAALGMVVYNLTNAAPRAPVPENSKSAALAAASGAACTLPEGAYVWEVQATGTIEAHASVAMPREFEPCDAIWFYSLDGSELRAQSTQVPATTSVVTLRQHQKSAGISSTYSCDVQP